MLKKVVFPAPLGPMIETIDRCGMANDTSPTATRPPNALVMLRASSSGSAPLPPPAPSPTGGFGALTAVGP